MNNRRPIRSLLAQAVALTMLEQSAAAPQAEHPEPPKPRNCVKCRVPITIGRHCATCLGTRRA